MSQPRDLPQREDLRRPGGPAEDYISRPDNGRHRLVLDNERKDSNFDPSTSLSVSYDLDGRQPDVPGRYTAAALRLSSLGAPSAKELFARPLECASSMSLRSWRRRNVRCAVLLTVVSDDKKFAFRFHRAKYIFL